MARKKAVNQENFVDETDDFTELDLIPREEPPTALELDKMAEEKTLAEFMADITDTDQVTCSVHRAAKGKAKGAYLFQYQLRDVPFGDLMDRLRDDYGGGEFRIFIYRGSERIGNKGVEVEAPRSAPNRDKFGMVVNTPQPISPQPDNTVGLIVGLMQENSRVQVEMMARIVEATSNKQQMVQPAQQPMTATEIVTLIKTLSEIGGKKDGIAEVLEAIRLGKELAGDGGGGGSTVAEAIKAIVPSLATLGAKTAAPAAVPVTQARQNRPVTPEPVKAPEPAGDETAVMLKMICRAASMGHDPETYANLVIDQMGEEQTRSVVTDDTTFQIVLTQVPPDILDKCGEWFAEWRAIVIELLNDSPDDPDGEDATPPVFNNVTDAGTVQGAA